MPIISWPTDGDWNQTTYYLTHTTKLLCFSINASLAAPQKYGWFLVGAPAILSFWSQFEVSKSESFSKLNDTVFENSFTEL